MGFLNIIPIHGEFTVMSHSWDMLVPIESYLLQQRVSIPIHFIHFT